MKIAKIAKDLGVTKLFFWKTLNITKSLRKRADLQ